jgi:acetyltransferase-like isoleucine patch superfamily enzyme
MINRGISFIKRGIRKIVPNEDVRSVNINIKEFDRQKVKYVGGMHIRGKIFVQNKGSIVIGKGFEANSGPDLNPIGGDTVLRLISFTKESQIIIGNHVGMSNCTILAWEKIEIGDYVMIGGGVRIWDTNFHSLDPAIRTNGVFDNDVKTAPIKIDNYAFIGAGSIILKGVHIGENSIVAAGSVVVKSIPANVVAGGNPCKVIRNL